MRRQPRLGSEPDRRVDGAEAGIVPPLDDLKEEAAVERARVDLEVLGRAVAVVEDLAFGEARDRLRREIGAGLEVVVVVFRDRQEIDAVLAQSADGREDVVGRERDVLDAGAEQLVEEARRKAPSSDATTWLCTMPPGSSTSWTRVLPTSRSEV